jgi:hypothetical protein
MSRMLTQRDEQSARRKSASHVTRTASVRLLFRCAAAEARRTAEPRSSFRVARLDSVAKDPPDHFRFVRNDLAIAFRNPRCHGSRGSPYSRSTAAIRTTAATLRIAVTRRISWHSLMTSGQLDVAPTCFDRARLESQRFDRDPVPPLFFLGLLPLTATPRAARPTGRSVPRGARAAMPPSVPPPSAAA